MTDAKTVTIAEALEALYVLYDANSAIEKRAAYKTIRAALTAAAAEADAHRWVHFHEHVLPKDNHYYLVAYDDEQIGVAWYHSGDWLNSVADSSDGEREFDGEVYAYAELPAPPKGST